jgi:hypothetical protein
MVGGLFVVGTAAGVASLACAGSILGSQDYLVKAAAGGSAITIGALFVLLMGFALAMVPVLMSKPWPWRMSFSGGRWRP